MTELKDLVGLHVLTGVDMSTESIASEYYDEDFEDCQVLRFCLDGKVYVAIEDPSDGYRSMMREIKTSQKKIKNAFPETQVFGTMRPDTYDNQDVLDLYDVKTSKIVISVGTSECDDYYPSFVAEFHPENMWLNEESK